MSLNADQESSPSHGLLLFHRQSCSTVAAGRAPFETETLRDVGNGFQSWASASAAVYSWSTGTQILLRHVLGLSTPLLHQGDVTDSFPSVHFSASCGRFWTYVLPTSGWVVIYFFRFGGSAFCVRTRRENFLLPTGGEVSFMFSLSRYFRLRYQPIVGW